MSHHKDRHAWHATVIFSAERVEMGHCITFKQTKYRITSPQEKGKKTNSSELTQSIV